MTPRREPQATTATDEFMRTEQAAELLRLSRRTLEKWRVFGGGPRFVKAGKICLYRRSDLLAWTSRHTRRSTSDTGSR